MRTVSPRAGLASVRREGGAGLRRTVGPIAVRQQSGALDTPGESGLRVDVSEMSDVLVVKAEMPGLYPDEIEVALRDRTLIIQGRQDRELEGTGEPSQRARQTLGVFIRAIRLPAAIDVAKATASFVGGLLTIVLPKGPVAGGTPIPIRVS